MIQRVHCFHKYTYNATQFNDRRTVTEFKDAALFITITGYLHKAFRCVRSSSEHLSESLLPSASIKQFENCRTDFHGTWYFGVSLKFVDVFQLGLKSDINNGHFASISARISFNARINGKKNVSSKYCTEKQTHFMPNILCMYVCVTVKEKMLCDVCSSFVAY
jgi:hypothetical protein